MSHLDCLYRTAERYVADLVLVRGQVCAWAYKRTEVYNGLLEYLGAKIDAELASSHAGVFADIASPTLAGIHDRFKCSLSIHEANHRCVCGK